MTSQERARTRSSMVVSDWLGSAANSLIRASAPFAMIDLFRFYPKVLTKLTLGVRCFGHEISREGQDRKRAIQTWVRPCGKRQYLQRHVRQLREFDEAGQLGAGHAAIADDSIKHTLVHDGVETHWRLGPQDPLPS